MLKEMQTIKMDFVQGTYSDELSKKYIEDNEKEILCEKEKMVSKLYDLKDEKSLQKYLILCIFSELYGKKENVEKEKVKLVNEIKIKRSGLINVKNYVMNIVREWKEKYHPNIIQIIFNEIILKYKLDIARGIKN